MGVNEENLKNVKLRILIHGERKKAIAKRRDLL